MSNCCPVQNSLTRHLNDLDESEAFDIAVDNRKEQLMQNLSPEFVAEALCEVPMAAELWLDIINGVRGIDNRNRVYLENADNIVRGLYTAIALYAEKEALYQIRNERDNPLTQQDDDHE